MVFDVLFRNSCFLLLLILLEGKQVCIEHDGRKLSVSFLYKVGESHER